MEFKDYFSDTASLYATARPRYPRALIQFIADNAPGTERAWDCATGNGQVAVDLATVFDQVEATDASREQIESALSSKRVCYSVQPAEKTNFKDQSFDVVCVAQAVHWFQLDYFYRETKRVLRSNGLIALWGYNFFSIENEIDTVIDHYLLKPIRPHWAPENKLIWDEYRDLWFPFDEIATPRLEIICHWTLDQLLTYVKTWSATRRCIGHQGDSFLRQVNYHLNSLWPIDSRKSVKMPLCSRFGFV